MTDLVTEIIYVEAFGVQEAKFGRNENYNLGEAMARLKGVIDMASALGLAKPDEIEEACNRAEDDWNVMHSK